MKAEKYLLSTAYFPPIQYMALIAGSTEVLIEREENYSKQTFRNRCYILSTSGALALSVPVLLGSIHKTALKDIQIDYSKRWQQIHCRGITSSYESSPYYLYYSDRISKVINSNHKYLLDLNMDALKTVLDITGLSATVRYTNRFEPTGQKAYDFRYEITPKKKIPANVFKLEEYCQVFNNKSGFVPGLSIIDLIFNVGPDCGSYLREAMEEQIVP